MNDMPRPSRHTAISARRTSVTARVVWRKTATAPLLVPLFLGAAGIVAALLILDSGQRHQRLQQIAHIEVEVRNELVTAVADLDAGRYTTAREKATAILDRLSREGLERHRAFEEVGGMAYMLRGEAAERADPDGPWDEVAEDFRAAAQGLGWARAGVLPWSARMGYGRSLYRLGDDEDAIRTLERLIRDNPSYGEAYRWRSLAYRRQGDLERADADEAMARRLGAWVDPRDAEPNSRSRTVLREG